MITVKKQLGRVVLWELLEVCGYSKDELKPLLGSIKSVVITAPMDDVLSVTIDTYPHKRDKE